MTHLAWKIIEMSLHPFLYQPNNYFNKFKLLFRLNFSKLEIEIFCARYDKDGDHRFDVDELKAIELNLGEQVRMFNKL